MVCPVFEGKKTAIPLGLNPVYSNSDGSGGKGEELAEARFNDMKKHLNVEGARLLQMQGKVVDRQYMNEPFVSSMNKPIFDFVHSLSLQKDEADVLLGGGNVTGTLASCLIRCSLHLKRTVLSNVFLEELQSFIRSFAMEKCMLLQQKQPRNCIFHFG